MDSNVRRILWGISQLRCLSRSSIEFQCSTDFQNCARESWRVREDFIFYVHLWGCDSQMRHIRHCNYLTDDYVLIMRSAKAEIHINHKVEMNHTHRYKIHANDKIHFTTQTTRQPAPPKSWWWWWCVVFAVHHTFGIERRWWGAPMVNKIWWHNFQIILSIPPIKHQIKLNIISHETSINTI